MEITDRLNGLEKQLERVQLQLGAICKHYGISLEYQPHDYSVNQVEQEGEDTNGE